jgi:hypothetical protein
MKLSPAVLLLWLSMRGCSAAPTDDAVTSDRATPKVATDARAVGLAPSLYAVRRGERGLEPLGDGSSAREGDLVQLGYAAAGHTHGVIVSIDGLGHVTLHHPAAPDAPPRLRPRGRHPLGHAFELDAAQGFERFVFVASGDERLDPQVVLQAAAQLGHEGEAAATAPLPLPSTWHQSSLLLRKP